MNHKSHIQDPYPSLEPFSMLLNQREFSVKYITAITRRMISHWQKEGLLGDGRNQQESWRRFSLVDLLWIGIIAGLRQFGLRYTQITKVQTKLSEIVPLTNGQKLSLLEFSAIEIIIYAAPVFLIVDREGNTEVAGDAEYGKQLRTGDIDHHLVLSLNKVVEDNFAPLYTKPEYSQLTGLTPEEVQVLEVVRSQDFESIRIIKKNGVVDLIEGLQRIQEERRIVDLLREGQYQNIEVKQSNGKIVCINRTVKRKLNQ